jgi:LPS export ABC transporter protein LptC
MRRLFEISRTAAVAIALTASAAGMVCLSCPSRSLADPALTGTKLMMKSPKYSGYTRGGGRRYEVAAASAVQQLQGAGGVELDQPRVRLESANGTTLDLSAATGLLDFAMIRVAMRDDVVLRAGPAHEIHLSEITIDLRNNTVVSETPFEIVSATDTIRGHRLEVSEAGVIIILDGTLTHSGNVVHFDRYMLE